MAYSNIRELYDDPDAYAPKFKGSIRVLDYVVGSRESEFLLEMLIRAWHRLATYSRGGRVDYKEGTLEATFSPRDWETFAKELGVSVTVHMVALHEKEGRVKLRRPPVDNLGTPSLRRDDLDGPVFFKMKVMPCT